MKSNKVLMSYLKYSNKSVFSFVLMVLTVVSLQLVLSVTNHAHANQENWQLKKKADGIEVYVRDSKNSAVKPFKGVMTMDGTLSSVLAVIEDPNACSRWIFNCLNSKVIKKRSDTSSVTYVEVAMKWPVANRDSVVGAIRTQNKSTKLIEIKMKSEPTLAPKVAGKVRIESMHGRWLLRPAGPGKVNVIYEMTADPNGNVPKWLVNKMVVDSPLNTLKGLRKLAKEDKYVNAQVVGIIN